MRILPLLLFCLSFLTWFPATQGKEGDCIVVDMLPYLIDYPGNYCLESDLATTSGDSVIVLAQDVIFDLNGFSLTGAATGFGVGIYVGPGSKNVAIRNGTIRDYQVGLMSLWSKGHHRFENLTIFDSSQAGIVISGGDHAIRKNHIEGTGSLMTESTVSGISVSGDNNDLIDNVILDTAASSSAAAYGVRVIESDKTLVLGTRIMNTNPGASGSSYGIHVTDSRQTSLEQNAVINLTQRGSTAIWADDRRQSYCAGNYVAGYLRPIQGCYDGGGNTVR